MSSPTWNIGLTPRSSTLSAAMNASANRTINSTIRWKPQRSRSAAPSTATAWTTIAGKDPHTSTIENVNVIETKDTPNMRIGPRTGNGRASATTASTASAQNSAGSWRTLLTVDRDLSQPAQEDGS